MTSTSDIAIVVGTELAWLEASGQTSDYHYGPAKAAYDLQNYQTAAVWLRDMHRAATRQLEELLSGSDYAEVVS